jgi:prevent-host-death family protein
MPMWDRPGRTSGCPAEITVVSLNSCSRVFERRRWLFSKPIFITIGYTICVWRNLPFRAEPCPIDRGRPDLTTSPLHDPGGFFHRLQARCSTLGSTLMKTANIHEAKTRLSKLLEEASKGESFIIAKAGKPIVKVTARVFQRARRCVGLVS